MTNDLRLALFIVSALVLGIAGCGKSVETTVTRNCAAAIASGYCDSGGTKCDVKVEMASCGADPTTTPDKLYVCKPRTKITWHLKATSPPASGIKFASNGIDFSNPEFDHPRPGNQEFEWTDIHSKADPNNPVKYKIHILTKDATLCRDVDPLVINE